MTNDAIGDAPGPTRSMYAVLKVMYLLAVTAAVFAFPAFLTARSVVVPVLLALQTLLLLWDGIPFKEVARSIWRLKWLLLVLLACYALLPGDEGSPDERWTLLPVPFTGWQRFPHPHTQQLGCLLHLHCLQRLLHPLRLDGSPRQKQEPPATTEAKPKQVGKKNAG